MMQEGNSVTVYDVEKKKAVLVFVSHNSCSEYLLNKKNNSSYIKYIVKNQTKIKHTKNIFKRTLAVRNATVTQEKLIKEGAVFEILDEDFRRTDIEYDNVMIKKFRDEVNIELPNTVSSYINVYAGLKTRGEDMISVRVDKNKVEEVMSKVQEIFDQYK